MADDEKVVPSACNVCLGETKHTVLFERESCVSETVQHDCVITWTTTTRLLECRGCSDLSLVNAVYCDEDGVTRTDRFPPAVSRQQPKWHAQLPQEYQGLLSEVYQALHADNRRLALMGARALIDIFMVRQVTDMGRFDEKLEALATLGYLSARDVEVLKPAIDAGGAAAHRGYRPSEENASCVIDIVEHLLQKEVLGPAAVRMQEATPPRQKAAKATP